MFQESFNYGDPSGWLMQGDPGYMTQDNSGGEYGGQGMSRDPLAAANLPGWYPGVDWAKQGWAGGQTYTGGSVDAQGNNTETVSPEFQQWLQQKGYKQGYNGSNQHAGLFDKSGSLVPGSETDLNDHMSMLQYLSPVLMAAGANYFMPGAIGAEGALAGSEGASLGGADGLVAGEGAGTAPELAGGAFNEAGISSPSFGMNADFAGVSPMNGGGMDSLIPGISNGSLLNFGGNLLSGYMGANAANKGRNALVQAGQQSNDLQKYMYDTTRSDYAPYREEGISALSQIQALLKDPSSISQQPGYKFGMDQGTKALNNGAAARGMTYSGQQGKALQQYGQDYAGTKLNDTYNRLAGIAGIGQTATSGTANAGANYAGNVGNTLQNMGNANASGYVGSSNAWGGAIGNALGNYQMNDLYSKYLQPRGG
jgi:hypothetical protein